MRTLLWSAIIVVPMLLAGACGKTEKPAAVSEPAASATAPVKPAPSAPAKRATVDDLVTSNLQSSLKCTGSQKTACEIIEDFSKASAWNLDTIRGQEARYFGKGVVVKGDKLEEQYFFMIAKKAALNEVGAGDLPFKMVFQALDKSLQAENTAAAKLVRMLERDDGLPKGNPAEVYVSAYPLAKWDGATQSKGLSTFVQSETGAYVRMSGNRKLLVLKPASGPDTKLGEGIYAALYPLSW